MDNKSAEIGEVLAKQGFQKFGERIEYQASINKLPDDSGTPFNWKPLKDLSQKSLVRAAALLDKCSQGDPSSKPDDNAFDSLKEFLGDSTLTTDPACVNIGRLDGIDVAIVIAQSHPSSGRARITYMGLLPEYRGNSLGQWVHRHGFSMMKQQGASTYFGGTMINNYPMISLFTKHGCKEFQRFEEWILKLTP
jgi:ribosomal protein S18 acetylase RimI-like enzyme